MPDVLIIGGNVMVYPRVEVDLNKLKHNVNVLVHLCKEKQIEVAGVTKVFCGNPQIAKAYVEGGVSYLADSRIENLIKLKDLNLPKMLIRIPMLSEVDKVVEYADVKTIFTNPLHPYTQGLLGSIPDINRQVDKFETIEGLVPSLYNLPKGCRFSTRCKYAFENCTKNQPKLVDNNGHKVACFKYSPLVDQDA